MSGPRLFLIQGLSALVSVNTEINTTLQSAPFINGVTHLMRASLTHIDLPLRRGPSRNCGQLPAWILSASAAGRSSHPASSPSLQRRGESKTSSLEGSPKTDTSFKGYFTGLLWTLFFISLSYFRFRQTAMDGFLLKPNHKIFSKWAKALIKTVKRKAGIRKELNETWGIFHCKVSLIQHPRLTHKGRKYSAMMAMRDLASSALQKGGGVTGMAWCPQSLEWNLQFCLHTITHCSFLIPSPSTSS